MTFADKWEIVYFYLTCTIVFLLGVMVFGGIYATFEQFKNGRKYLRYILLTIILLII